MLKLEITKNFTAFRLKAQLNIASDCSSVALFGPSGSGKTLTLQCIAGLAQPDAGKIEIFNRPVFDSQNKINIPPQKRNLGYMIQDYALFPHLTVLENAAYAKSGLFGRCNRQLRKETLALLETLGIAHLANHLPRQISGGQRQRAALARAINSNPKLLLLDEPFSALDPLLREAMRQELRRILITRNLPAIIITHDPDDVDVFADALFLFNSGAVKAIPDWPRIRPNFVSAAACLRSLQSASSSCLSAS